MHGIAAPYAPCIIQGSGSLSRWADGMRGAAGALSANLPSQGQSELPEAAEDVCAEPAAPPAAQEPAAEEPLPSAQGHQVLPDHHLGLGGGRLAGTVSVWLLDNLPVSCLLEA